MENALVDDFRRNLGRGNASLLIQLDLSAAFTAVDHGIFLELLVELGMDRAVLGPFHT